MEKNDIEKRINLMTEVTDTSNKKRVKYNIIKLKNS